MKPTTIVALAAALVLAGCGESQEYVPKKVSKVTPIDLLEVDVSSIMPLQIGNQWVYSVQGGGRSFDITIEVVSVEQVGGATIAVIEVNDGQGDIQPNSWRVDDTGVYQLSARDNLPYDPPQQLVQFPIVEGAKFSFEGTGPLPVDGDGAYRTEATVLGVQEIDTALGATAGRMSAIAVQSKTTWQTEAGSNFSRATAWWVPGIGFVRQMQEFRTPGGSGTVLLKLKSYSFK